MSLAYIGMGFIVGVVVGAIFLDIDSICGKWAKREEKNDSKRE